MPLLYWGSLYKRYQYGDFDRDELIYYLEEQFGLIEKLTQMVEQGKESEVVQKGKLNKIKARQSWASIEYFKNDLMMSLSIRKNKAKEKNRL